MKLNIAWPQNGAQKTFAIDDDHKLMPFFEKRMGADVAGDSLGPEFKGYIFRITGGNDKQGFPMKQGILQQKRVRLLFKDGMSCYRARRKGMLKRKSVRGCIVGADLSIMNLMVVKEGDAPLEGVTDQEEKGRRLGPKRASKIRKLFDLEKSDDVRKFVVRRVVKEEGKGNSKAPKIQRLVTNVSLQRKRRVRNQKKLKAAASREQAKAYHARLVEYHKELKEKRAAELAKKKKGKKVAKK